jgi:hypothetical protein
VPPALILCGSRRSVIEPRSACVCVLCLLFLRSDSRRTSQRNLRMWKFQPWVMNVNRRVPRFPQRNLLLWRKCLRLSTILRLKETINTLTHPLRLVICRTEMSLEQWRGPCHLLPNTKDQSGPRISTWIQLVVPQTLILHSLSCVFIY